MCCSALPGYVRMYANISGPISGLLIQEALCLNKWWQVSCVLYAGWVTGDFKINIMQPSVTIVK